MFQVHINLGAGEKELASARELTLNDMSWHEVNLTRRDANITLRIDGIHSVGDILPGRFFELNINFGVYIGGQGGFNELFLGSYNIYCIYIVSMMMQMKELDIALCRAGIWLGSVIHTLPVLSFIEVQTKIHLSLSLPLTFTRVIQRSPVCTV